MKKSDNVPGMEIQNDPSLVQYGPLGQSEFCYFALASSLNTYVYTSNTWLMTDDSDRLSLEQHIVVDDHPEQHAQLASAACCTRQMLNLGGFQRFIRYRCI